MNNFSTITSNFLTTASTYNNTINQTFKTNGTRSETSIQPMDISQTAKNVLVASYIIIFIVGFAGNTMVIYVIGLKHHLVKSSDIQIVSLAVADALSSVFLPIVQVYDIVVNLEEWKLLGTFGCKFLVSIDHITMLVSAFILVLISVERLRVIGSLNRVSNKPRVATIQVVALWLLAIAIVSPYIHALGLRRGQCVLNWKRIGSFIYYSVYTNLSCFVPAIVMVIVYTKSVYSLSQRQVPGGNEKLQEKRNLQYKRITKMFGTIVVLFFLLTMPNTVIHFISSFNGTFNVQGYIDNIEVYMSLTYGFYTLSHFNCCVNPFIYANMHTNMKKSFLKFSRRFTRRWGRAVNVPKKVKRKNIDIVRV